MIALIAGTGALPAVLVKQLRQRGEMPMVYGLVGSKPELPDDIDVVEFRLEHLGSLLNSFVELGVAKVCMAGAIERPSIDPSAIDDATRPLVPTLMSALKQGDDGALRAVIGVFEQRGLEVIAAHKLSPELLPEAGILTASKPRPVHESDALVGDATIEAMGRLDVGQACVVRDGNVLAQEGQDGTDAMLDQLCAEAGQSGLKANNAREAGSSLSLDQNGILFKAPKPNQTHRADMPVIGPETARKVVDIGLDGIVIEAGAVMVLDMPNVLDILSADGRFLWVRPNGKAQ